MDSPDCGNHIIGGSLDFDSEFERRLAVGAQLACHLRAAVKEKLGNTDRYFCLGIKILQFNCL